ncbi:UNVERIFIED_CONTAM: hypothetical protein PYX00_004191 [Menopon gallinae]|uniref:Vacuolar protein sorting-associated protein 51 homolog n=1 Tax=Menopon gallinae TaxID=328185 RepID=A0AAW2I4A5_9NEOP
MADSSGDPFDMNSPCFNSDMFLQRTFKDCALKQIMDVESEVVRDIATLHSDMQTLVYENYNKFISATETVRKMKFDFKQMEKEMNLLEENMNSITAFSEQISSTLQDTRSEISRLSSVHSLLKELQFLFKLPNNLRTQIEEGSYAQAIEDYLHAQPVLEQYGHMPSFQGIQGDIEVTLSKLKQKLHDQIKANNATAQQLTESVDLLMKLHEPCTALCTEFLAHCQHKLKNELNECKNYNFNDVIEFVDSISNGFLSDLCLAVQSYNDMFLHRPYSENEDDLDATIEMKVNTFFCDNMKTYFEVMAEVLEKEQENGDTAILARALDRFYRRLQAMNTLVQGTDFMELGTKVIIRAGERQCKFYLHSLKSHFTDNLTRLRQSLASVKTGSQEEESSANIPELLNSIILTTVDKLKSVLQDLLVFIQPDLTYGVNTKFQEEFCIDSIREGVVIGFLHHLMATARSFCSNPGVPSALLLVLSKFCLEFQQTFVHHLLSQTDEWFNIDEKSGVEILTSESEVCSHMREAAQSLINAYVRSQGLNISQMLRKSVETRDWLHTIEPRTVRAVMKRVLEDITAIETQVGLLYEEGQRSERSSDSSRKTGAYSVSQLSRYQAYRSNWSSYAPGQSSIAPNIHFQLFSERIEIFSSVEFSKVSILTGIIKISLKTLLECVRLRTFSRYGLQQIQVDTHYLQLHLWRFVSDENLVHFLLYEILGSAVHRCLDPVLMEPSVVEIICERG